MECKHSRWVYVTLLIKIWNLVLGWNYNYSKACCIFKIDSKRIRNNLTDGGVNYESSVQEKINYSKEKGLIPLLKFIENKINRYLLFLLCHDKFRFKFTGIDNASLIEENRYKE